MSKPATQEPAKSVAAPHTGTQEKTEGGGAPKPEGTVTSKLFPDFREDGHKDDPNAPKKSDSSSDDAIDFGALKGKKVKIGDETIAVDDVARRLQSVAQLTQQGAELTKKEHELNEREKALRKEQELLTAGRPVNAEPSAPEKPTAGGYEELLKESVFADDPVLKRLLSDFQKIQKENEELLARTARSKYEENVRILANSAKQKGHDDFMKYHPKIEEKFRGLPQDQRQGADSFDWWMNQFLDMKLADTRAELEAAKNKPLEKSAPSRPEGAPMDGVASPDGSGGRPNEDDKWQASYDAALKKAKASGALEDWSEVFRLKEKAQAA